VYGVPEAKVFAAIAVEKDTVAVWLPIPVFAVALKKVVAVGAVTAAGTVYGKLTFVVAKVHVVNESHARFPPVGAAVIVVAEVGSVWAPLVNVVDVSCSFHPVPEPVASFTSTAYEPVDVWSTPLKVTPENEIVAGNVTPRVPALTVTLAATVAPAGDVWMMAPASAPPATSAPTSRDLPKRLRFTSPPLLETASSVEVLSNEEIIA
jgi:hypothetical protein